jgi:hypothetical protein
VWNVDSKLAGRCGRHGGVNVDYERALNTGL